tara:strand:- start:787 stop:1251 length:465 start_codon:yes stop_codon:yes gene_type:complete
MKVYKLKYKQTINRSIDEVFDFFKNPENLSKLTPSNLNFKILTPMPIEMKEGQLIDYTITLFGKKIHWRTIISDYVEPNMFVDQQLKGPYLLWHHKHEFNIVDRNVEMIDEVNYAIPFGFLGQIAHYIYVRRELEYIFSYRNKIIKKYLNKGKL